MFSFCKKKKAPAFLWVGNSQQKRNLVKFLIELQFVSFSRGVDKWGNPLFRIFKGKEKLAIIGCANDEMANLVKKSINIAMNEMNKEPEGVEVD